MIKRLAALLLFAACAAHGQQNMMAYKYSAGSWIAVSSTGTSQAVTGQIYPAVHLYCYNSGTGQWVAADSNCFGGAGQFTALTGDATSTSTGGATTVVGINGTLLSGLATGILKNTATTGVPSIAGSADILAACTTCVTSASSLTSNAVVLGGGAQASKTATGFTTDGTSILTLGVAGTSVGSVVLNNATSGSVSLAPVTGALGTVTASFPANSGTVAELNFAQTFSALQSYSAGISISSGQVLAWNADTGISRSAAGSITIGNGTQGSQTGGVFASNLIGASGGINTVGVVGAQGVALGTGHGLFFQSGTNYNGTTDTTLCRSAAGVVEVGSSTGCASSGTLLAAAYQTASNCSSSASPAVCGSAAAGSVALPTNAVSSSIVVNTTAVTANSQIFVFADDTLGTKLSVTCNSTVATLVGGLTISARTAGTSFTIANNVAVVTNPLCVSYLIVN